MHNIQFGMLADSGVLDCMADAAGSSSHSGLMYRARAHTPPTPPSGKTAGHQREAYRTYTQPFKTPCKTLFKPRFTLNSLCNMPIEAKKSRGKHFCHLANMHKNGLHNTDYPLILPSSSSSPLCNVPLYGGTGHRGQHRKDLSLLWNMQRTYRGWMKATKHIYTR